MFRCSQSGEREPQRLFFKIYISVLSLGYRLSLVSVLTVINKVNSLTILRDSWVNYKFVFFHRCCPRCSPRGYLGPVHKNRIFLNLQLFSLRIQKFPLPHVFKSNSPVHTHLMVSGFTLEKLRLDVAPPYWLIVQ